jgi:hypothetical protein
MNESPQMKCFTIMPFRVRDADLPRYYNESNHWNEVYQGLILVAAKQAGLDCARDDEDATVRLITDAIWRKIEQADVVLCDLSSNNPNVYLELGWALRADKRFVLIKDDVTQCNFDVSQFYTYEYSHRLQPLSVRESIEKLVRVIKATLADDKRDYSMVRKLSLDLQATQVAAEGNVEVSLLKEVLAEVRASLGPRRAGQSSSYPRFYFPEISTQAALGKILIGTTWRKRNDLEHVIFQDDATFFNNHAGHPSWRQNSYRLGERLGSMTLEWAVDGLKAPCQFNDQFNEFVELANPAECLWSMIANKPFTPAWGI